MKTKSSKLKPVVIMITVLLLMQTVLYAQKIKDMDEVKYLQLPTLEARYSSVNVYVKADQSGTRDALSFGLGKIAGDNEKVKDVMEGFVNEVFADQVEKYGNWTMYQGNISAPDNADTLKAVITYSPDDTARPMGTPMKNNRQEHVFNYRVKAHMRIYDKANQMLAERNFGVITGRAHSKTWPETTGDAGSMFSVSTSDEDNPAQMHPYEVACIEGAIDQTYRVLYGMYGINEFIFPRSVATIKKQKESKDYSKKCTEILEKKKSIVLNKNEKAIIQECIDYWESILASTKEEYLWAVHYNLAIGYGWVLNSDKSREHIRSFYDLKKDTFDKIENKSGSFSGKDLAVLEAYNMAQPFAEYYAEGINLHPDWVELLTMDLNSICEVNAINHLIANTVNIDVPLPVFPRNYNQMIMKKCSGTIYKADEKIMELKYKIKKGYLENLECKGVKNTITDGIKDEVHYTSKRNKETREKYNIFKELNYSSLRGRYTLDENQVPEIHSLQIKYPFVWRPFDVQDAGIKSVSHETQRMASFRMKTDDNDLLTQYDMSGNTWYSCKFSIGDSVSVTLNADKIAKEIKPLDFDENGIPSRYQVSWNFENATIHIHAHIKYKLLEETYTRDGRQRSANRQMRPVIHKMLKDNITAHKGTFTEKEGGKFDISVTYEYDFSMKNDSKGNWTEINFGDYRFEREIKY